MPCAMPLAKKVAIKNMLELELEHKSIAAKMNCTTRHVRQIKKNILDHGSVERLKRSQRGPKPKFTAEMGEVHVFHSI
jgi:hypothetical protein